MEKIEKVVVTSIIIMYVIIFQLMPLIIEIKIIEDNKKKQEINASEIDELERIEEDIKEICVNKRLDIEKIKIRRYETEGNNYELVIEEKEKGLTYIITMDREKGQKKVKDLN